MTSALPAAAQPAAAAGGVAVSSSSNKAFRGSATYLVFLPPANKLLPYHDGEDAVSRRRNEATKWKRGRKRHLKLQPRDGHQGQDSGKSVYTSVRNSIRDKREDRSDGSAVKEDIHSKENMADRIRPAEPDNEGTMCLRPRLPDLSNMSTQTHLAAYRALAQTTRRSALSVSRTQYNSKDAQADSSSGSSLEMTPAEEAARRLQTAREARPQLAIAAVPLAADPLNTSVSRFVSPGQARGDTMSGLHYSSRLDDGTSWTETILTGLVSREQDLTRGVTSGCSTFAHRTAGAVVRGSPLGELSTASITLPAEDSQRLRLEEEERAFLAGPFSLGTTSVGLALQCRPGEEGLPAGSQEGPSISRALRSESEVWALQMEMERVRKEREEDDDGLSVWPVGAERRGKVRFISARQALSDRPDESSDAPRQSCHAQKQAEDPLPKVSSYQELANGNVAATVGQKKASQTQEEEEIPLTPVKGKRRRFVPPTPLPTPSTAVENGKATTLGGVYRRCRCQCACQITAREAVSGETNNSEIRGSMAWALRKETNQKRKAAPCEQVERQTPLKKKVRVHPPLIGGSPMAHVPPPQLRSDQTSIASRSELPFNLRKEIATTSHSTSIRFPKRANQSVCRFNIFGRATGDVSRSTASARSGGKQMSSADVKRVCNLSNAAPDSKAEAEERPKIETSAAEESTLSRIGFIPPTMRDERDDLIPVAPQEAVCSKVEPASRSSGPAPIPGVRPDTPALLSRETASGPVEEQRSALIATIDVRSLDVLAVPIALPAAKAPTSSPAVQDDAARTAIDTEGKHAMGVSLELATPSAAREAQVKPAVAAGRPASISYPPRPPPVPIMPLRSSTSIKTHRPSKLAQSLTAESLDRNMKDTAEKGDGSLGQQSDGGSSSARGQTMAGLDSIPPPPSLHFDPRTITSLLAILRNPTPHLPAKHGGCSEQITSPRLNVLVLVREIGPLEEIGVKVFKKGKVVPGAVDMMARSELVVVDGEGGICRVVLWGDCALQWAGSEAEKSGDGEEEEEEEGDTTEEQSNVTDKGEGMTTTMTSVRDDTTTYGGVLLRAPGGPTNAKRPQEMDAARRDNAPVGPLRPGDVVCLSKLIVSPIAMRPSTPGPPAHGHGKGTGELNAPTAPGAAPVSIQLVASSRTFSRAEVCWRWDLRGETARRRRRYRFDVALTEFDRRCKEVWKCAARWEGEGRGPLR